MRGQREAIWALLRISALALLLATSAAQGIQRVAASDLRLELGTGLQLSADAHLRDDFSTGWNGRISLHHLFRNRLLLGVQYRVFDKDFTLSDRAFDLTAHMLGLQCGSTIYRRNKNEVSAAMLLYWTHVREVGRTTCPTCPAIRSQRDESGVGLGARVTCSRRIAQRIRIGIDLEYNKTFLGDSIVDSGNLGGAWLGGFLGFSL